ncbi:MAG: hypothetical protein ACI4ED_04580 [Suilimivivens sp.]
MHGERDEITPMLLYDLLEEKELNIQITFRKKFATVFDLSYLLVDIQAVINGFCDMTQEMGRPRIEEEIYVKNEIVSKKSSGYRQTTNRIYNGKRKDNLQLHNFSKGSLILDIGASVIAGIMVEFLSQLMFQKYHDERMTEVHIENCNIFINGSDVRLIPRDSCLADAMTVNAGINAEAIDAKQYIKTVVRKAAPDEDIEASVKRLLAVMQEDGVIRTMETYDAKGMKTLVRDTERFLGNFCDMRA